MSEDKDSPESDLQKIRAELREKFLRTLGSLKGKKCVFHMYGGTSVTGIYNETDLEFQNIIVGNLDTPVMQMKHSILRITDILSITAPID